MRPLRISKLNILKKTLSLVLEYPAPTTKDRSHSSKVRPHTLPSAFVYRPQTTVHRASTTATAWGWLLRCRYPELETPALTSLAPPLLPSTFSSPSPSWPHPYPPHALREPLSPSRPLFDPSTNLLPPSLPFLNESKDLYDKLTLSQHAIPPATALPVRPSDLRVTTFNDPLSERRRPARNCLK